MGSGGGGGATFLLPVTTFALNHHEADRSGNYIARDFAFNLLQSAEPFGIVFTNGDNDTFPLWYAQEVEGVRKDVVVANLSLLNTTWYLEQLESRPFSASPPRLPVRTALPADHLKRAPTDRDPGREELRSTFGARPDAPIVAPRARRATWCSLSRPGYRPSDLAVMKVLGQSSTSSLYFSHTVPTDALVSSQPYLTRSGILYEVNSQRTDEAAAADTTLFEVPNRPGLVFDVARSDGLLWEVYRFAGLQGEDIFKDGTTRSLIKNYGYTMRE